MLTFREFLIRESISKKLLKKFSSETDLDNFVLSEEIVTKAFEILNANCFSGKLDKIPISIEKVSLQKFQQLGSLTLAFFLIWHDDDEVMHYSAYRDRDSKDLFKSPRIVMFEYGNRDFKKFLAILAHEMIHYLSYVDDDERENIIRGIVDEKFGLGGYDNHGAFFRKNMEELNSKFGLDVKLSEKMSKEEYETMMKIAGEKDAKVIDENDSSIIKEDSFSTLDSKTQKKYMDYARRLRRAMKDDGTNFVVVSSKGVCHCII